MIIINGQRIFPNTSNTPKEVKKVSSISAGETFEHDGPVEVTGNIEDGAIVKITNGGISVSGNVGDSVRIQVKTSSKSGNIISMHGDVSIVGVNITGNFNESVSIGGSSAIALTVKGTVGNGVTLECDHSINIQSAGNNFIAKAGHTFSSADLGDYADVTSGHSLTLGNAGFFAKLDAGFSLKAKTINEGSTLHSGHGLTIDVLRKDSKAKAGHSLTAQAIDARCFVECGHTMTVEAVDYTAQLKAGFKKHIKSTIGGGSMASVTQLRPKPRG